jgi:hypothetical protein
MRLRLHSRMSCLPVLPSVQCCRPFLSHFAPLDENPRNRAQSYPICLSCSRSRNSVSFLSVQLLDFSFSSFLRFTLLCSSSSGSRSCSWRPRKPVRREERAWNEGIESKTSRLPDCLVFRVADAMQCNGPGHVLHAQGGHSPISKWCIHLLKGLVQTAVSAHLQRFGE